MNFFKNILVIQKTSKLSYLIEKCGLDACAKSVEYNMLQESMNVHTRNCDKFLHNLLKVKSSDQTVDVVNDNFLHNEIVSNKLAEKKYDLIFSLGGDGTFLRSAHFIMDNYPVLIGINTDRKNSVGFYCPIHIEHCKEENLRKMIESNFTMRSLNKIEIEAKNKKHYFMNDLYFGEKFLGRISKYKLQINDKREEIIKSSGVIFSTYSGYSGWIRNANTISYTKFANLVQKTGEKFNQSPVEDEETVKMYSEKLYMPQYENENSIFYFVREPGLKRRKENSVENYVNYLNFMEGSAKTISLENYCFEAILILDGSFTIPVDYNETIKIAIGDRKIKTLAKL